jgi:hypothetical protein
MISQEVDQLSVLNGFLHQLSQGKAMSHQRHFSGWENPSLKKKKKKN